MNREMEEMTLRLLSEIRWAHREPRHESYSECEKEECYWCTDASKIIDALINPYFTR